MELTNSLRKTIISLDTVKGRRQSGLFAVEGVKAILETLPYFRLHSFWATAEWMDLNGTSLPAGISVNIIPKREFDRISFLKTPQGAMAVYYIPDYDAEPNESEVGDTLTLALDGVQDPGNLGTIIRIADWFGIDTILASRNTADVYSPKVVQATMGAIGRVKVFYVDLARTLTGLRKDIPVYGTFLDGENIYQAGVNPGKGVIVMGNEGNGISPEVARCVSVRLLIPSFAAEEGREKVESLNVGVATAVTVAEFRRRGGIR